MKKYLNILILAMSFLMTSCIDDFKIDTEDGKHLVGINAYFTNEYKKHQIVISKTTDFYSEEESEMISGAEVFIHDGVDTIYFKETERKGYYETIDSVYYDGYYYSDPEHHYRYDFDYNHYYYGRLEWKGDYWAVVLRENPYYGMICAIYNDGILPAQLGHHNVQQHQIRQRHQPIQLL